MKKANLPRVSKFDQDKAESLTPIPKCADDQAGNWQGGAKEFLEDGLNIENREPELKIRADLI